MSASPRVLLLSPPLTDPAESGLGVAMLKAVLATVGVAADALYGNLRFPRFDSGAEVSRLAMFYFAPHLNDGLTSRECADTAFRILEAEEDIVLQEVEHADGATTARRRRSMQRCVEAADTCIERCVDVAREYDVVGFSCTFEAQLVAGLAIASRLHLASPGVKIAFGGAACFPSAAQEVIRRYGFVDAVCYGEGEPVIGPLVEALSGRRALASVPSIVWRDGDGAPITNPAAPLLADLDPLPYPDHDDFFTQLQASEWADVEPRVYFEASRGCWWGEKHLCTFCGLNADGLAYRAKSPDRAYDEIVALYERHPGAARLFATDNILDMRYLRTLLPRLERLLTRPDRPLRMFFEVKSNLSRDQIAGLARAGVDMVQTGIESFNDGILALMKKGATGLMQVQCVKWLWEESIQNSYNLLVRNPGESADQYRALLELLPYLVHLPPPHVSGIQLERFSPYHSRPEAFGLANVQPRAHYSILYRRPGLDVGNMAYCFDFDHPTVDAPALAALRVEFVNQVVDWRVHWRPDRAHYTEDTRGIETVDRRSVWGLRRDRATGAASDVFGYLDHCRPRRALARRFPDLEPEAVECLLDTWRARRWVCRDARGRSLVVLPRRPRHLRSETADTTAHGPHTVASPTAS